MLVAVRANRLITDFSDGETNQILDAFMVSGTQLCV